MIGIVSYGVANTGSMLNMLRRVGQRAFVVRTPLELSQADRLILPGVGAFDHGTACLQAGGWFEPIRDRVINDKIPLLGVCLGMQLLGNGSEEGTSEGLGLIAAHCERFRQPTGSTLKVPHMGWKELDVKRQTPLLQELESDSRFYFVHSYHLVCDNEADAVATARYGIDFTAVVQSGNVSGTQFHPEKSHRFGMALLRNFARL